jgi:hypothetical protein
MGLEIAPNNGSKEHEELLLENIIAFGELLIAGECKFCLGIVNSSRSETARG